MSRGRSLKIAVIAPCPYPTGQGSQVLIKGLHETLGASGFRSTVYTYHLGDLRRPCRGSVVRIPGIPFYRKYRAGPAFLKIFLDILLFITVLRNQREVKADLLHVHNYEGLLIGLALRPFLGIPVVYHSHNLMGPELPSYFRNRLMRNVSRRFGEWLDRTFPRRADHLIAITEPIEEFFLSNEIHPSSITLLLPSISVEDLRLLEEVYSSAKARPVAGNRCGMARHDGASSMKGLRKRILYAGNLDAYQDLDILLDALLRILEKRGDVELIVLTGSQPRSFRDHPLARELGDHLRIILTDSFYLTARFILHSDIAVSPRISPYGFPMKLLNYMALARPIMVPAGSPHGLVDGESVFETDGSGPENLARAILFLLENSRRAKEIGEAARKHLLERHLWPHRLPELVAIYREILD